MTSLQFTLVISGTEIRAESINHTQTVFVGGTKLHCTKNEKNTHSKTDRRLKATPVITVQRLHKVREGKTHRAIILRMVINNVETLIMAIRGSGA